MLKKNMEKNNIRKDGEKELVKRLDTVQIYSRIMIRLHKRLALLRAQKEIFI